MKKSKNIKKNNLIFKSLFLDILFVLLLLALINYFYGWDLGISQMVTSPDLDIFKSNIKQFNI